MRAVAVLAGLAGVAIIVQLPFAAAARAGLNLVWLVHVASDLRRLVRSQRRCVRIRFGPGGEAEVVTPGECCIAATIRPGSIVTNRFAWLRLDAEDGSRYRELVRGNCLQNDDWRRFQVIWRHLGAGP